MPLANLVVDRIDAGRSDLDQDLSRVGLGYLDVDVAHHLRTAVLLDADGFHGGHRASSVD